MEARYYDKLTDNKVQCKLCPHNCIIADGRSGICKVRTNKGGILNTDIYGCLSATHFDPIEKKPLYHFFPGSEILSLGGLGCNFHCACCQNYEISQTGIEGFPRLQYLSVGEIIKAARANPDNLGIAYTYNEPNVWYEYMFDIAQEIRQNQGKNVIVSNGYINEKPLRALLPIIDAFNIDVKAFDDKVYKNFAGGELKYILNNLKIIKKADKHLEITLLIVPGINDSLSRFGEMIQWIINSLGKDVPLHLSRYFPHYKMKTETTDLRIIEEFAAYASKYLNYVYIGNVRSEYQNTYCPNCGSLVIQRHGYYTRLSALDGRGYCITCGQKIVVS